MKRPEEDLRPFQGVRRFGCTFSTKELERRGIEWQEAFEEMKALNFNAIRVAAYWSDIEAEHGRYDFDQLDELLDKCDETKLDVVLTVGMKGPRWPEFHIPTWAESDLDNEDIAADKKLCDRCLDYVEALIAHVASRSCIVAFQVENEPLDKAGEKRQIVGIDFVAEEANLVRKIDTNLRPIIISAWCWSFKHDFDVKDALRYGNILGLDVYSKVRGDDTTGVERAGKLPKHYKELANAKGREAWITELQAESWNPSTFDPDDMKSLLKKVSDADFTSVFLWGFEKWYDAKINKGDDDMWKAVKLATANFLNIPSSRRK